MNTAWMILAPAAVAASSFLFVNARRRALRALSFALLLGGIAGIFAVAYFVTIASEREAARCASLGGIPASGQCWIDGRVR